MMYSKEKMQMKPGDTVARVLVLYNILKTQTDRDHIMTTPQLADELEAQGFSCDRRTIYDAIRALQDNGYDIRYTRHGQGYWLEPEMSAAEVLFLADAVQNSPALSLRESRKLIAKLTSTLSEYEQDALPIIPAAVTKTSSDEVLHNIELLLKAIPQSHPVNFRYFDLNPDRSRRYRKNRQRYHLVPYAVVSNSGRFYCVCWSEGHEDFAAYRIDKMDCLEVCEETADPRPFDLASWLRSSFNMYKGAPDTVTCDFDISLINPLYDQFGSNIIISSVSTDSFRASIRTAVTPTLISWLLQFYDRLTVISPPALISSLNTIADTLHAKYAGGNHDTAGTD